MNTITYKLREKNQHHYQIKDGRRVIENIYSVSGGWHVCCRVWDDLEKAISVFIESQEQMLNMLGGDLKVVVVNPLNKEK